MELYKDNSSILHKLDMISYTMLPNSMTPYIKCATPWTIGLWRKSKSCDQNMCRQTTTVWRFLKLKCTVYTMWPDISSTSFIAWSLAIRLHVDRILPPCNYCHHPWCVGHKSYHKALSIMFDCDGISDHASWNEVLHYRDTKLSWYTLMRKGGVHICRVANGDLTWENKIIQNLMPIGTL